MDGTEGAKACLRWYALRLFSNRERAVQQLLDLREIENYWPVYTETVRWSDRSKQIHKSLFPGYLFIRFDVATGLSRLFGLPGFCGIVGAPTPLAIDDSEIELIRKLATSEGFRARAASPFSIGEPVEVATGPLAGVTGTVTRINGLLRLSIAFTFLRRSITVDVDAATVRALA